jgi:hypothetical protein
MKPFQCPCGERAAQAEMNSKANPPRCFICRLVRVENPDASEEEVTRLGKARWARAIEAGQRARKEAGR